ncbi:MAG TPA: exopolysaccharide biosynthesis polyprenyl glycosylphosphotransferase [Falsiroseomonas sp.]|jgi:exopolysaccharide biosynthesis polyprenyl glycosylphosphotransferase|nr:exopolysaccharide biosynthesis polyprenyl glycosylphosphotransferase [Falsiroseomonas sp.]
MTSLFGHSVRSDVLILYVADALLCFLAIYALLSWQVGVPFGQGFTVAVTVAAACGIISGASGLYQPEAFSRARKLIAAVSVAGLLLLILLPVLSMMSPAARASLDDHLFGVTLAFVSAVVTTRLGFALALRSGRLAQEVAVLRCPGRAADEAGRLYAAAGHGGRFNIALDIPPGTPLGVALAPERLRARRIRAVIATDPAALPQALRRDLAAAGIEILRETEFLEHQLARVDIDRLPEGWLARSNGLREGVAEAAFRRGFDILLSTLLLLATLPLLVAAAIAIKLDTPGPIFYRQERVGRAGRIFTLFKFRSMVVDAEAGGAPVWASRQDDRITRVGRFIRLTRIDEIPQVFNVLFGDMAFVGPRPERPAFVEKLGRVIPHYDERAVVKPGITGWAQVNFPYGASVEDARMKLAYDLYYVRRRSLFLDLLILVATVRVVLFQEGSR